MALALFDLDNTLLAGDSDYEWGQFLVSNGIVDAQQYAEANQRFYDQYKAGTLDIYEFVAFAFQPLSTHSMEQLLEWRQSFVAERIQPIMLAQGQERINWHKEQGDQLLVITATNSFVTRPIAEAFGIETLLATEPEQVDGEFTGKLDGIPCFQDGKVERLKQWMAQQNQTLEGSWFYSDSHNDLPLLQAVDHPVAVDADETLTAFAREQRWTITSFRN